MGGLLNAPFIFCRSLTSERGGVLERPSIEPRRITKRRNLPIAYSDSSRCIKKAYIHGVARVAHANPKPLGVSPLLPWPT